MSILSSFKYFKHHLCREQKEVVYTLGNLEFVDDVGGHTEKFCPRLFAPEFFFKLRKPRVLPLGFTLGGKTIGVVLGGQCA